MKKVISILAVLVIGLWNSSAEEETVWSVPEIGHKLAFPGDHGSHPDFKIEWWYLTGHLFEGDRRFGFQATFFRLGQEPVDVAVGDSFGESQIYMAHMGVSDPETGRFIHEERLNRGGWDAGAKVGGLDVFNGDWRLVTAANGMKLTGSIKSEAAFYLKLTPHKRHVVFGEDGISRKGPEGTAASYYITFPRLDVEGTLLIDGKTLEVAGGAGVGHGVFRRQRSGERRGGEEGKTRGGPDHLKKKKKQTAG